MKWKRIWISLWLLALLAIFVVTLVNHSPYFLLGGSSSVAPLMEELLNKYPDNHKKGDFNYVSSASSGAPIRVESGMFAIGWLSKEYTTTDPSMFTFELMRDGLVIVYNIPASYLNNPDVPLNFTAQKIQDLYLNKKSWKQVFPDEIKTDLSVKTFTRPNGSGTRDVFDNQVLDGETYYKANTVDSSSAMLTLESGSIGYSAFADVSQAKQMIVTIGQWMGVLPTLDNIGKPDGYQLWRPFTGLINYYYKYNDEIIKLLRWVFSGDTTVADIFKKYGPKVSINDPKNFSLKQWLYPNG